MTDRESLGKVVRDAWVKRKLEKMDGIGDPPETWDEMTYFDQETDCQIAEAVIAELSKEYSLVPKPKVLELRLP